MLDVASFFSLFGLCFVTFLFIQILRYAICKKPFNWQNPFAGTFAMGFSSKCEQGFSITTMIVGCCCLTFILMHLIQEHNPKLTDYSFMSG